MKKNQGQTLLMLVFFIAIAMIVISTAIMIIITNTLGATQTQQGIIARQIAESGIEEALLRLLRNPGYTGGTLDIGNGYTTINVTNGTTIKTIQSIGIIGNSRRQIIAKFTYNNYIYTLISWQDIQ